MIYLLMVIFLLSGCKAEDRIVETRPRPYTYAPSNQLAEPVTSNSDDFTQWHFEDFLNKEPDGKSTIKIEWKATPIEWIEEEPAECKRFYDGCNYHTYSDDGMSATVTAMWCEKYGEPECLDGKEPAEQGELFATMPLPTPKELIEVFAKQGKICEVFGHWWFGYPCTRDDNGAVSCHWETDPKTRTCKICGLKEKWTENWEGVE